MPFTPCVACRLEHAEAEAAGRVPQPVHTAKNGSDLCQHHSGNSRGS